MVEVRLRFLEAKGFNTIQNITPKSKMWKFNDDTDQFIIILLDEEYTPHYEEMINLFVSWNKELIDAVVELEVIKS